MARPKIYSIRLTDDERAKLNKVIQNRDYMNKGIGSIIRYNISPNSAASRRKADGSVEAKLIQIACGPAPDGHSRCSSSVHG